MVKRLGNDGHNSILSPLSRLKLWHRIPYSAKCSNSSANTRVLLPAQSPGIRLFPLRLPPPRCGQSLIIWPFLPHLWHSIFATPPPPPPPLLPLRPLPEDIELTLFRLTSLRRRVSASLAASALAARFLALRSACAWAAASRREARIRPVVGSSGS